MSKLKEKIAEFADIAKSLRSSPFGNCGFFASHEGITGLQEAKNRISRKIKNVAEVSKVQLKIQNNS
jgi:hypothetical protein